MKESGGDVSLNEMSLLSRVGLPSLIWDINQEMAHRGTLCANTHTHASMFTMPLEKKLMLHESTYDRIFSYTCFVRSHWGDVKDKWRPFIQGYASVCVFGWMCVRPWSGRHCCFIKNTTSSFISMRPLWWKHGGLTNWLSSVSRHDSD